MTIQEKIQVIQALLAAIECRVTTYPTSDGLSMQVMRSIWNEEEIKQLKDRLFKEIENL